MHVLCASPPDGGAYNYLLNRFVGVDPCTLNGVVQWRERWNGGDSKETVDRFTANRRNENRVKCPFMRSLCPSYDAFTM